MMRDLENTTQKPVWVFSPLFVSAVCYATVLRILDVYLMIVSTVVWYSPFWLNPVIGFLSRGDLIVISASGLWVFSIIDLKDKLKSPNSWLTMVTCLLLVLYTAGICLRARYFAEMF